MENPGRLSLPALTVLLLFAGVGPAAAQTLTPGGLAPERVTDLAATGTGLITGRVSDQSGQPIEGVVISAFGSTTAFALSDKTGQFSLRQLPPGAYLLRAHREGYLAVRGTIVEVRPSGRTASTLTLQREGSPSEPHVIGAGVGVVETQPADPPAAKGRDESELGWRIRHLKRAVLRDADGMLALPADDSDFFLRDSFEMLGRAVGQSARAAGALFGDLSIDGQVDLLTTGAFDSPVELLQLDRTRSVAFFSFGAPVGGHGDWAIRAALNQGDFDSWIFAGSYAVKAHVPHRYQIGSSFSVQRYQPVSAAQLATGPASSRGVSSVFGFDDWAVSERVSIAYGATYAHYDYLGQPSLVSPQIRLTVAPLRTWRVHTFLARQMTAPGAQEFLPASRTTWLPPQRTFSAISSQGFSTQALNHYEVSVERVLNGATIGGRVFRQDVSNQLVTVFGVRQPDSAASQFGHYYVGSTGNASVSGWGVTFTHALAENVRGSVDYAQSLATRTAPAPAADLARLERWAPVAIVGERERIHDVTTSVETEVPQTATRVLVFYRLNSGFIKTGGSSETRGLDGRFDLQVNQALPFMNFLSSQWEMLVGVRNVFYENAMAAASTYDEILVIRPPKRIVGGLTVRF